MIVEHIKRCYLIPTAVLALLILNGFAFVFLNEGDIKELLFVVVFATAILFHKEIRGSEHIKRCYFIPTAVSITLLVLNYVFLFGVESIVAILSGAVFASFYVLFYIGIAESISAVIYRRTFTSTVINIAFLVFFAVQMPSYLWEFVFMLSFIGIAGAALAFFNGRTATAIVSGIAILVYSLTLALSALSRNFASNDFDVNFPSVAFLFFTGGGVLAGGGMLAVAFITHTNMTSSKLKAFYLIPPILLAFFQFYSSGFFNFNSSPCNPYNSFIHRSFASFMHYQFLPLLITGGCIIMGINRIIYSNDPNINSSKIH